MAFQLLNVSQIVRPCAFLTPLRTLPCSRPAAAGGTACIRTAIDENYILCTFKEKQNVKFRPLARTASQDTISYWDQTCTKQDMTLEQKLSQVDTPFQSRQESLANAKISARIYRKATTIILRR